MTRLLFDAFLICTHLESWHISNFSHMSETSSTESSASTSRGRGRGKSRGGLGKYLRARGRRGGPGRPAEFGKRLVLEDEELEEDDPESEEAQEYARKFSRRQLGTNADRYKEEEPELGSDGASVLRHRDTRGAPLTMEPPPTL
jgi:hypothetical protein